MRIPISSIEPKCHRAPLAGSTPSWRRERPRPSPVIVAEGRVLVRVQTAERHLDGARALAKRLEEAWIGTGISPGTAGCALPFRASEDGVSQYAVCWVKRDAWSLLVHGALWVSFAEQGLATPEVFADDET